MIKKLSYDYQTARHQNFDISVELRRNNKGLGLYATKLINREQIVAYYKVKVYENDTTSEIGDTYKIGIMSKTGKLYKYLYGDLYNGSFSLPVKDIQTGIYVSFLAPFINEPTPNEKENVEIDFNILHNYARKNKSRTGEIIIYKFRAIKDIEPDEEILWYYGDEYCRNYEVNDTY